MENRKAGLKVFGIVAAIFVVVLAMSLVFSTVFAPIMKYNTAVKNAEKGNYVLAFKGLYELKKDYEDSELKKQEYALKAGKGLLEGGNMEMALPYIDYARNMTADEALTKEAQEIYDKMPK